MSLIEQTWIFDQDHVQIWKYDCSRISRMKCLTVDRFFFSFFFFWKTRREEKRRNKERNCKITKNKKIEERSGARERERDRRDQKREREWEWESEERASESERAKRERVRVWERVKGSRWKRRGRRRWTTARWVCWTLKSKTKGPAQVQVWNNNNQQLQHPSKWKDKEWRRWRRKKEERKKASRLTSLCLILLPPFLVLLRHVGYAVLAVYWTRQWGPSFRVVGRRWPTEVWQTRSGRQADQTARTPTL